MFAFNACKDGSQKDGDEGEDGRDSSQFGEGVERPRQRAYPGEYGPNGGEADSTDSAVAHGIQVLCAGQDVKALT